MINPEYVVWICYDCAREHCNNDVCGVSTWHTGICDVCNKLKGVTEPRDFGYMKETKKD